VVAYMHAELGLLRIERQDAVSAHLADQVVTEQHHVMMAVSNPDQPVSPKQKTVILVTETHRQGLVPNVTRLHTLSRAVLNVGGSGGLGRMVPGPGSSGPGTNRK
jgi:hypothetical protein